MKDGLAPGAPELQGREVDQKGPLRGGYDGPATSLLEDLRIPCTRIVRGRQPISRERYAMPQGAPFAGAAVALALFSIADMAIESVDRCDQ